MQIEEFLGGIYLIREGIVSALLQAAAETYIYCP